MNTKQIGTKKMDTSHKIMAKKKKVYGVEMTSLESMQFAKYRDNKGIAMNTLTEIERFELTKNWLDGRNGIA